MSYEKQTWASGDIITANKLNHMEDGIAQIKPDLYLYVSSSGTEGILPLYKDYTHQTTWTYEELFPLVAEFDETEELKLKANVILVSGTDLMFPSKMVVTPQGGMIAPEVLFSVIKNVQGTIMQLTYGVQEGISGETPK